MNTINKISIATLIVCSVSSSAAFAQTSSLTSAPIDAWYFMPSASAFMPDSSFAVGDRGEGAGLTLGKPLSKEWDIQIATKYAHKKANGFNYQQNMLGVDALYLFNREQFRPFLLVGAGYQQDRINSSTDAISAYSPYANIGLGFQMTLDRRWGLQLDLRREQGHLKSDVFDRSRNYNNYVSLGISYTFD